MKDAHISFRLDSQLYQNAKTLADKLGIPLTTVVILQLKQFTRSLCIPQIYGAIKKSRGHSIYTTSSIYTLRCVHLKDKYRLIIMTDSTCLIIAQIERGMVLYEQPVVEPQLAHT